MERRVQLLSRLSRCGPGQQVPGAFLEAVLASANARGEEVGALARRQLGDEGGLVESYRYPVTWMLGMLDVIGQAAETRGESYGEALFRAGQDAGLAYVRTTVGRVRVLRAMAVGPHRTLEGIPNAARAAVNFGEHSYRRLSPGSGELVFKQDLIGLAWNAGMVLASTSTALSMPPGALKLEGIPTDEDASSFLLHLSW